MASTNIVPLEGLESAQTATIIDNINLPKVADTMQKIAQFQSVVQKTLKNGHDYGVVGGTKRPTLLKPGAEKILMLMGLTSEYEIIERVQDYESGFFAFSVKCVLYRNGIKITEGLGHANTRERRYNSQDPFTLANTVLKMAKKRAQVDAVLTVASLSEIFTQDLEDDILEPAAAGTTGEPAQYWAQQDAGIPGPAAVQKAQGGIETQQKTPGQGNGNHGITGKQIGLLKGLLDRAAAELGVPGGNKNTQYVGAVLAAAGLNVPGLDELTKQQASWLIDNFRPLAERAAAIMQSGTPATQNNRLQATGEPAAGDIVATAMPANRTVAPTAAAAGQSTRTARRFF